MNNISPERVGQLKGRANRWAGLWQRVYDGEDVDQSNKALIDLLAILDDYSALKAENERLLLQIQYPDPEDMPGELAAKFCPFNEPFHFHHDGCPSEWAIEERIKKAEAELAKQRPLIEAVMGLSSEDLVCEDWPTTKLQDAALALREEKK